MFKKVLFPFFIITLFSTSCVHEPQTSVKNDPASLNPVNRDPSSEDPWTDWSEKNTIAGLRVLKKIREDLLANNMHDPHVSYHRYKSVDCSKVNTNFRTADGTCYDLQKPHAGAAGVAFGRNVPPQFIDKNAARNLKIPNPAVVSQEFFTREEFKPVPFLNMLAAVWIQFMNHDWLTHGPNALGNPHQIPLADGTTQVIDRTQLLPQEMRDQYSDKYSKVTLNHVTHWWDASQIYGSSLEEQKSLRAGYAGKMKIEKVNNRELLPKNNQLNPRNNRQNQGYELTGFRDNWWLGLSLLHTLFVKEHNKIAEMLFKNHVAATKNPEIYRWYPDGKRKLRGKQGWANEKSFVVFNVPQLDEHIFQTARLINSAVLAKIHTVEWTPAILPNPNLIRGMCANWYGLANPKCMSGKLGKLPSKTDLLGSGIDINFIMGGIVGNEINTYGTPFSITEEFTSVYRLHSLLPEEIELRKLASRAEVNKVPFPNTRNEHTYAIMENNSLGDLFYSFGVQLPGQLVLNNFPHFMQDLEVPGHGSMDLGMVDVLRDRERGVPRYNQFRRAIGLKPIKSYSDFFKHEDRLDSAELLRRANIVEKFQRVYGSDKDGNDNVEMIDLLVGTLAEEVRPSNFGFGETMFQIFILMASRRLMADKFFTTHYTKENYTEAGLKWVDDATFASVISRHMPELKGYIVGLPTAFSPWHATPKTR